MIRLLHTADWHIGQTFYEYDRKFEHTCFLRWMEEQLVALEIDVLLIAGDVFDGPNPSADSQSLFYRFLKNATTRNPELQIIIIAGNHDSAARLEALNPLLETMNVSIRGVIKRNSEGDIDYSYLIIPMKKKGEIEAYCLAVPYLRHGDYPHSENYASGVKTFFECLYDEVPDDKPIVVMGHLHAAGSEISENDRSERIGVVGGIESVAPNIFARKNVIYTALGHLHKAQRVAKMENVRYAGSPIPMSFAEIHYKQGVNFIEIQGKEDLGELGDGIPKIAMKRVEFDAPVALLSLPKEPQEIDVIWDEIASLPDGEADVYSPFLELKVLIKEPEPALRHKIEEALKNKSVRLACLVSFTRDKKTEAKTISYEELKTINPMEIAEDVFARHYGGDMPVKMKTLLNQLIEEVAL